MGSIKNKVNRLIQKYNTNDPFELAQLLGIEVLYENLGDVLGYYSNTFRIPVIHINNNLNVKLQRFTCSHELGHAILHHDTNTTFLKSKTLFSTDRLEIEANTFAIELLFSQSLETNCITTQEATEEYGIPEQLLTKKFYP